MKSTISHTPGPWRPDGAAVKAVSHGKWFNVAVAKVHGYIPEGNEANARLIAAAPELLAALQTLVREGECYCADNVAAKGLCGHCEARAVLARATQPQA